MNKKSIKNKSIFKGAALGVALLVCGTTLPFGAFSSFGETWQQEPSSDSGQISDNTNRIEVDANTVPTTVEKGGEFTIPQGHYFGKSSTAHVIGSEVSGSITESKVVAYYAADDSIVYDSSDEKYQGVKTFGADRLGRYIIKYSVLDDGKYYSYQLELRCVTSEVSFEFDSNDTKMVPSVYDLSIANEKDILIPVPTVSNVQGKEITDLEIVIDGQDPTGEDYLRITLDQAYSEDVKVARNSDGDYYIKGSSLTGANGYSFDIVYKYYQNGVQISSTKKSFTVNKSYYTDTNDKAGYNLKVELDSSRPSSATVGVEKTLPGLIATTSSTDKPADEAVSISYSIKVDRRVNGVWTPVENTLDEDNNFKAPEPGDYRFVYTATDFYGHTATTEFTIVDVADTLEATPYVYDAGDENAKNKDGSYKSAETLLKSKTVNRNIIMYAIGGSDNYVDEGELTLTRRIRTATGSLLYEITSYDEYNLIFKAEKDGSKGLYRSIYDDNYQIRRQMTLKGIVLSGDAEENETTIKNWLQTNKYRIVTKSRTVDPVTGSEYGAELTDEQLLEKGYAYITPNTTNADFSEQTYRFCYVANDNVSTNSATEIQFEVEVVENADDATAPSILYLTELQSSYLDDEVITLTEPTVSDTGGDGRAEIHTAYRYLDSKRQPITSEGDKPIGSEIKYIINEASKIGISSNKWYIQADGNNVVTSSGWTILEGEDEYEIRLANKPQDAAYIEFFSYAIDDQGNVGFYDKQCYVSNIEDTVAPTLYQVVKSDETGYVNNETIVLPTLYYQDNLPQYMTAGVVVYKVDEEDPSVQTIVHSSNMSTYYDSLTEKFVLEAGSFTASTGGDYLVAVTVSDAGRHSITTYFSYHVTAIPNVEDPEIANISSTKKEIVINEAQKLPVPTLSVSDSEGVGYIGISDFDSEKTASYYTISAIYADSNDYELSETSFTAKSRGTYKLRYDVFVISYLTDEEYFDSTGASNGKLFMSTNSKGEQVLAYKADGTEKVGDGTATAGETYYIFAEKTEAGYELKINRSLLGIGKEMAIDQLPTYDGENRVVELHHSPSKIIEYTAGDVAVNLYMDDSDYETRKFADTKQSLIVKPINADVRGNGEIDKDKSTVSISVTTGSSTRTIATISMNNWNSVKESDLTYDEKGNLVLLLNTNGRYKLTYTVAAKNIIGQPVGSTATKEYEFTVGDLMAPTINIDNTNNQFIKSTYNVGDVIDIQVDKITVEDETTTDRDDLLKGIVIQVKNTSTNTTKTLSNTSSVPGNYAYSYKIEEEGKYTVSIYVRDIAGNASETKEYSFTVGDDGTSTPVNVQEVVGQVLIGVSVAILAGVVIYFVVSKVKENKSKKK